MRRVLSSEAKWKLGQVNKKSKRVEQKRELSRFCELLLSKSKANKKKSEGRSVETK